MIFSDVVCVPKIDAKDDPFILHMIDLIKKEVAHAGAVLPHVAGDAPLFIALGGDGTMLAAMKAAASRPNGTVIGFNFGRLGFLTNGHVDNTNVVQMLRSLLNDEAAWKRDSRMTISSRVAMPNDHRKIDSVAINEFLVTTKSRTHQLTYDVFVNDSHIARQAGDGVIVTTATGSTAYAMSAGGAIMAPTSRAMQIVPLAAHTVSSRPVVVSENDTIRITANATSRVKDICLLSDNRYVYSTHKMNVEITRHRFVDIWRPKDWNYFEVLRKKLGWNYGESTN